MENPILKSDDVIDCFSSRGLGLHKANELFLKWNWGRVMHICIGNLNIISSDNGLSPPSHYLNQCWNIVNWTPRNKLQWNVNRNSNIFIQENPFENGVWKMAAILSRPQCVKRNDNYDMWEISLKMIHKDIYWVSTECHCVIHIQERYSWYLSCKFSMFTHTHSWYMRELMSWLQPY